MTQLSLDLLVSKMAAAAKQRLADDWPAIADYVTEQMKLIALTLIAINTLQKQGEITPEQGKADFDIAKNTVEMTLITEAGLTKLMAQQAIASALEAIKDVASDLLDVPFL